MKSTEALRVLAELTSYQWGMVTSAQASMRGVTRLDLSRLAEAGHLTRLTHGIYMDAGAPGDEFTDLRAAWLSTAPDRLAEDRLKDGANGIVIAAASAARLHGIGDLPASRNDFVSPARHQSQRREIRYRQRDLDPRDITLVEGMPSMTIERTIADLVEDIKELSLVADALRDASEARSLNVARLKELLAPLAERNGFRKDDGAALLNRLMEIAGLDLDSLSRDIAAVPSLGARVAANYVGRLSNNELAKLLGTPEMKRTMRDIHETLGQSFRVALTPQLEHLDASTKVAMNTLMKSASFEEPIRKMAEQLASSEAFRSLTQSWAKSLNESITVPPEMITLIRTAQQAAASG